MTKPLAIIPTYLRAPKDLLMCKATLVTLRETAGDACDVLVVDDGSPARDLVDGLGRICDELEADLYVKEVNNGFSISVNVGLRKALEEGRDAVLVNSDVEFGLTPNWLRRMQRQVRDDGAGLASIVGALLLYPNGLIQHSGVGFSLLTRAFFHRYQFGPGDLAEAHVPTVCPVTAALMFIRHNCLEDVGLFDEKFRLGWEDVDYNCRAWFKDHQCVYQPEIRAVHHESAFRGQGRADEKIERWTEDSWRYFCHKNANVNFAEWIPTMLTP